MGAAWEMQLWWYLSERDVQAAPGQWGSNRSPPTSTKQQSTLLDMFKQPSTAVHEEMLVCHGIMEWFGLEGGRRQDERMVQKAISPDE